MRLNLPLNGMIKAKGDILIHIAMLIASFFVYSSSFDIEPISQSRVESGAQTAGAQVSAENVIDTPLNILYYIRLMHGFMVGSHILRITTECDANDLLHMLLKSAEIWGYLINMIYLQYYLMSQQVKR